jgi:hypothetical protein
VAGTVEVEEVKCVVDNKSPRLYDSLGRLIPPSDHNRPTEHLSEPPNTPIPRLRAVLKHWLTGWRLVANFIPVGILLTLYSLRPVLSVSSPLPSDLHDTNGAKVSITNTGMKIKNVKVQCVTNKVLFKNIHTLEMDRFVKINEYSVADVGTGESFTGDCGFIWSLWTKATDGFFIFGGGVSGVPQMAIPFLLNNGNASFLPGAPIPRIMKPDFAGYAYNQVTAADGSFIVSFTWPWSWLRHERIIHVIARQTSDGLKWRVAPSSEPVIRDANPGPDGLTFTAKGPRDKWAVEMGPP